MFVGDLIELIIDFFSIILIPKQRLFDNIEYLKKEEWFKQQYDQELLNDKNFKRFVKKYNLKKILCDEMKKDKFKMELKQWVKANNETR